MCRIVASVAALRLLLFACLLARSLACVNLLASSFRERAKLIQLILSLRRQIRFYFDCCCCLATSVGLNAKKLAAFCSFERSLGRTNNDEDEQDLNEADST